MNNQDNVYLPEISTPIIIFPEKSKLVDIEDNNFKIVIANMSKELKGDMYKF